MNKTIAILTCKEMPDMLPYDGLIISKLQKAGVKASIFIWDELSESEIINLKNFDLVLIRTIWDYYKKVHRYLKFLNELEKYEINVLNPIDIVRWNMDKKYLDELQKEGFTIIPTLFAYNNEDLFDDALKKGWDKMILKPMISAGSYHTFVLEANEKERFKQLRKELFKDRPYMLQEFVYEIHEGEISTLTLNNPSVNETIPYSYSVRKVPKEGDYRVQFNYGGEYHLEKPHEEILDISNKITSRFGNRYLYKRLDGLWIGCKFHIMEIELIEPDLYLNLSDEALERFVKNIVAVVKR